MQIAKQLYERIAQTFRQIEQSISAIEISCTFHNYYDNDLISVIFATSNCVYFVVQF